MTDLARDLDARPSFRSTDQAGGALLDWERAATLDERLRVQPVVGDGDLGRAQLRWARWNTLPALNLAADPDGVLGPMGLSAAHLRKLLGESDDVLRRRLGSEPPWHQQFRSWWGRGVPTPSGLGLGLLSVIEPLIVAAQEELRERCSRSPIAGDPWTASVLAKAADLLIGHPPLDELAPMVGPSMILELNVARADGELVGATSEERFQDFVRRLTDRDRAAAMLREYAVLTRLVVTRLTFWVDRSLEFLSHLQADLPEIRTTFLLGAATLTHIHFGEGDSHRRGRSVGMVTFGETTIVYKPRDPLADVAFDRLLEWFNGRGPAHALFRGAIVPGADRLWTEFVRAGVPTDDAGADRFSYRLGALTALLYGLHATDFHFENVVATGEHPVLVDLEALLHVEKGMSVNSFQRDASVAARVLGDSVATVGVLPNRIITRADGTFHAVDVSAVGGHGGQEGIAAVPAFLDVGLDTMHIRNQFSQMSSQRNMPEREDGSPLDLIGRVDQFRAGFQEAYDLLREGRVELLADGGPLDSFGEVRARLIARPTFVYGRLLLQSYHPDFLRDGLDRSLCLGKLLGGHADAEDRVELIRAELDEMYDGDIPLFTVDSSTGLLRGGVDAAQVSDREAPIGVVRQRLADLSEVDRDLQTSIIDYSFLASSIDGDVDRWPGWDAERPAQGLHSGDFLDAATEVAHDVLAMACHRDGRAGWLGLELVDERWWTLGPASLDLYAGLPGIALALSSVGSLARDPLLAEAAEGTFEEVAQHLVRAAELMTGPVAGRTADQSPGIGAFGPLAGPMYALAHGAARYGRQDWMQVVSQMLPLLDGAIKHDAEFDVVAGGAGALMVLLALDKSGDDPLPLQIAGRVADMLLERAIVPTPGMLAWGGSRDGEAPLVGFSHGALGVAVALARLNEQRPDPRLVAAVDGALAYERGHLDPATGDWADLRVLASGGRAAPMRAWCHGSPGAALGRRLLLDTSAGRLADEGSVRVELAASERAIWDTGLGGRDRVTGIGNHSLCHGDIGNLLCLEAATGWGAELDEPGRRRLATAWAALVDDGRRNGFLSGVPRGAPTPGLMTGLSGIAWGLARRAAPESVADVLSVEGPRSTHRLPPMSL